MEIINGNSEGIQFMINRFEWMGMIFFMSQNQFK